MGGRSNVHRLPRRLLVALVVAATAATAVPAEPLPGRPQYKPQPGDFVIVCTLFNAADLPKGALPGEVPITYDPQIIVGARVERVTLGNSPWPVGTVVRFLIHSPTLTLGGYDFSGKQYTMTFSPFEPKTQDDLIWFEPNTRQVLRAIRLVEPAATTHDPQGSHERTRFR